jgi:aspartate kinase
MKVWKFGGTSVGSAQRIKNLPALIHNNEPKIVVLSAMSGTTNALVKIGERFYAKDLAGAEQLIDELETKYHNVLHELYATENARAKAAIFVEGRLELIRGLAKKRFNLRREKELLAEGEILSTHLVQYYLEEIHVPSVLLSALDFMLIDENDEPDLDYLARNLQAEMAKHPHQQLFLTQGYICLNADGEVDNLKRGGSDYTASLVGAAIMAEEVQIWTDIDGMHNNDPRIVDRTQPVAELTFDEAAELAYFGAKILHPQSVNPARLKKIPVRLLNTMAPQMPGTVIHEHTVRAGIKAVAAKDGITAIRIQSGRMLLAYGFLKRLFEVFEKYKTPIDMVTTSEVGVSVTIDQTTHLGAIVEELAEFSHVEVDQEQTIVCIVGDMGGHNYLPQVFAALEGTPVRMVSYGGSPNNVSLLVGTANKVAVLRALNQGLFGL